MPGCYETCATQEVKRSLTVKAFAKSGPLSLAPDGLLSM